MRYELLLLFVAACGRDDVARDGAVDVAGTCGHTFCDDFERSGDPQGPWEMIKQTNGGAFTVQNGRLLLGLPDGGASGFLETVVDYSTSLRIELEILLETADAGIADVDLLQNEWVVGAGGCDVLAHYFVRDSTARTSFQETYSENCGGNVDTYSADLVDGGIHSVVMTMETSMIRLAIDGVTVTEQAPARPIPPGAVLIRLGGGGRDFSAPWIVHYDNVIVDAR